MSEGKNVHTTLAIKNMSITKQLNLQSKSYNKKNEIKHENST